MVGNHRESKEKDGLTVTCSGPDGVFRLGDAAQDAGSIRGTLFRLNETPERMSNV